MAKLYNEADYNYQDAKDLQSAKKIVEHERTEAVKLWYAKKYNEIENLKARIKRVERSIKEFNLEELEIDLPTKQKETGTINSSGWDGIAITTTN